MNAESERFFEQLLLTPSPSGYEQPIQKLVRDWASPLSDEIKTDLHGNVIAVLNPGGSPRILLDGHCDQIGLMIQHIDKDGFLYFLPIGGWDTQILLGQRVSVWSKSGPIDGVIARKPKHLLSTDEAKKVPDISDLWIDIGARDQKDAAELIEIGDPVTVVLGMRRLRHGLVAGPKMDDTAGLFVVFETLRRLKGKKISASLHVVSAVQEEVGLRGATTAAFGIDPQVAIAVDVTHATDCPTIDKKANGDIKLGKGPVLFRGPNINPVVHGMFRDLAQRHELSIQPKGANQGTANDGNVLQLNRAGVATGVLGIPNRYMHSPVEVIALEDLATAAELMTQFVLEVTPETDFTPR
ncbi:MAG: M42 family metallopeptidase [Planctomycetota bacterium]